MLILADARRLPLIDGCVQTVVTSPPYWGIRDYGAAGQIGLEPDLDSYVAAVVAVFREVRRVLRDDGTAWVNLGDGYDAGRTRTDLGPKQMLAIPWRVALALQADGWILRCDIVWSKPNPMPESVSDRPTKAHEYVFLLSKSERYFYDAEAIKEPCSLETHSRGKGLNPKATGKNESTGHRRYDGFNGRWNSRQNASMAGAIAGPVTERNKRSVWHIAPQPYHGAHYATFPEALVEPCILAGCPVGGLVCDPFLGSGTVGAVAERLGRRWVGTDLSYQDLSKERTAQRGIRW